MVTVVVEGQHHGVVASLGALRTVPVIPPLQELGKEGHRGDVVHVDGVVNLDEVSIIVKRKGSN